VFHTAGDREREREREGEKEKKRARERERERERGLLHAIRAGMCRVQLDRSIKMKARIN
jgi:hypothetical protein